MNYKNCVLEMEQSDKYYAVIIRNNGLIVHTTTYYQSQNYAVTAAMRWVDKVYK